MSAEILGPVKTETREIRREDFAPGRTGEMSYLAVKSGTPCEAFIDQNKTKCGKPPIGTVDIDIRYDLEFFPFCTPEHKQLLLDQLDSELEAQGRYSYASSNGFGRNSTVMNPNSTQE